MDTRRVLLTNKERPDVVYLNAAAEAPAPAVAGLDDPTAAPARHESAWFAAASGAEAAAVPGASGPTASRLIAGACPPRRRRAPERVMAKPRAVSSSSARAETRTATVLRSLSLPPGPVPAAPGTLRRGLSPATLGQALAGVDQRGDRFREAAPDGP